MNKEEIELLNYILVNANIKAYQIPLYNQVCKKLADTFINNKDENKENKSK